MIRTEETEKVKLPKEPAFMTSRMTGSVRSAEVEKNVSVLWPALDPQKKKNSEEKPVTKHECAVCGYIFNPVLAERAGLSKDTRFEELPEDWCCPQCGTRKKYFTEKPQDNNK